MSHRHNDCDSCEDEIDETENDGCLKTINSECVIFNGTALPCLGIPVGANLNQIFGYIEPKFCAIQSTLAGLHNFVCNDLEGCTIGNLGNVTTTSPTTNQYLTFNGTIWVNSDFHCSSLNSCSLNDLGDVNTSSAVSGNTMVFNGTNWVTTILPTSFTCSQLSSCTFDNLGNVIVSSAVSGQTVMFNGSNWVNVTVNLAKGRGVAVIVSATGIAPTNSDIAAAYVGQAGFESPYNIRMAGDIWIDES